MKFLHLDFETRSSSPLKKTGAHKYAKHEDTEVLCLAYSIEPYTEIKVWYSGMPDPAELIEAASDPDVIFVAHNAAFERVIWQHVCVEQAGWPEIPLGRWQCTMAMAAQMGIPMGLAMCAKSLGLDVEKDDEGRRLMMEMTKPKNASKDTSERFARLGEYCRVDVEVEIAIHNKLRMQEGEQEVWEADQAINDRGVPLDIQAVESVIATVADEQEALTEELKEVTAGEINSTQQVAALRKYLEKLGVITLDLTSETVRTLLGDPKVTGKARRILEIRAAQSQGSVGKYQAMMASACEDGRARGLFQYSGAIGTGRWSGRRIQLQNLPRLTISDELIELAVDAFRRRDRETLAMWFGSVHDAAKELIRPMVTSPLGVTVADYAQIELRVVAWLAEQEDLLQTLRDGGDPYIGISGKIYGVPIEGVTKTQRQTGKVVMLGSQYGMGPKAFAKVMENFRIPDATEELANTSIETYRNTYAAVPKLWKACDKAAHLAYRSGEVMTAGKLAFSYNAAKKRMAMRLPSGRVLYYHEIEMEEGQYGNELSHLALKNNRLVRAKLYGGRWVENAAQAAARDLLACATVGCEKRGFPSFGHVHDELLVEGHHKAEVEEVMTDLPAWAGGLPVEVEAFECQRYTK